MYVNIRNITFQYDTYNLLLLKIKKNLTLQMHIEKTDENWQNIKINQASL